MTDDARAAAAARVAELRAEFAEKLVRRLAELESALNDARGGSPAARADALILAHRLAGTAGSFGYVGAGRHAARIEAALEGDAPIDDTAWLEIFAALAAAKLS